jgi:hypothetical protein
MKPISIISLSILVRVMAFFLSGEWALAERCLVEGNTIEARSLSLLTYYLAPFKK